MKIIVLGATGMLGHVACKTLSNQHQVIAVSRSKVSPELKENLLNDSGVWIEGFDALDFEALGSLFEEHQPDAVINCVGIVKQLEEAKNAVLSIEVNSLFPHKLANLCDHFSARLVHLSTDCVFSGKIGPNKEDQIPDPVDLYGRSKLLGEVDRAPHLTLRTSIIGYQLRGATGLVEWFLSQEGGEIKGFNKAIYSGLTTYALAKIIDTLLTQHPNISGLYQVSSAPITKYDLLVKINKILGLKITIHPEEEFSCDRSLDGSRFTEESNIEIPSWDEMLTELKTQRQIYESWAKLEQQTL